MTVSIIGYAQADFATLIRENRLYIDRTAYIRSIENESNSSMAIRFGGERMAFSRGDTHAVD